MYLQQAKGDIEIVSVQTEEDERYHCIIPESQASIDAVSYYVEQFFNRDKVINHC